MADRWHAARELRGTPIEERKRTLARLLRRSHPGIALNEHYDGDGAIIYKHPCTLDCEGIVSKQRGHDGQEAENGLAVRGWCRCAEEEAVTLDRFRGWRNSGRAYCG